MSDPLELLKDDDEVVPVWEYLQSLGFEKDAVRQMVGFLVLKTLALPVSEIKEGIHEIGYLISETPTYES